MTVTKEAFSFAQNVARDGVVTKKNTVYLAHYAQVLMDGYEARQAEVNATIDRLLTEREVMQRRIATLEAEHARFRIALDAAKRISQQGQESLRRIAELERQLSVLTLGRAILQPAKLNVEPDGDVIYA